MIDVYDYHGTKKYTIQKTYRAIQFLKDEIEEFNRRENKYAIKHRFEVNKMNHKFKKPINEMYYDNKNRLWVKVSIDRPNGEQNLAFDIFKEGIFINRLYFDDLLIGRDYYEDNKIKFFGDRIVYLNSDKGKISVFEYK